jgi:membrane protease subunit HflK
MPSGGPSAVIVLAIIALVVLCAWSAYYTVPSDSIAVVQRPEALTHGLEHQE